jgi:hypothetical protein
MIIEKEYMGELFRYDPKIGALWRKWPNGNWVPTAVASRYRGKIRYPAVVSLQYIVPKKPLFSIHAHRLVWILVNGAIPEGMVIDHINGVENDYRLENLRMITDQDNKKNKAISKTSKSNKTGVIGIRKRNGWWYAQIGVNNKAVHLGKFKSKKEAARVRFCAELEHGFHLNHGRKAIK